MWACLPFGQGVLFLNATVSCLHERERLVCSYFKETISIPVFYVKYVLKTGLNSGNLFKTLYGLFVKCDIFLFSS